MSLLLPQNCNQFNTNSCPLCRRELESLQKRNEIKLSNSNFNGLIFHELQRTDFNSELFQMYLDNTFVFNSGGLDLAAVGLNITGIKMLFESRHAEYLNLEEIEICSVIKKLLKREDTFELIKLLLTQWKRDLPSSYVMDPMNFLRECHTIEESVSDVTQSISDGCSIDFSMIDFIRDLFPKSLSTVDLYIIVEAIISNNISLLEYMKGSTYDFNKPSFLNFPDCRSYYWNDKIMPKEAMVFLLERVKEISDSDLIVLVQFTVFNDRDTDVFKKVLK